MQKKFQAINPDVFYFSIPEAAMATNLQQSLVIHDLIKTCLLRDGSYVAHLKNKDQVAITLDNSNWATIGKLKVVTVGYGDYSPAYGDEDQESWFAVGTRHFPADHSGIDDAVTTFMSWIFSNAGDPSDLVLEDHTLESIKVKYQEDQQSWEEAEENFSHIIPAKE